MRFGEYLKDKLFSIILFFIGYILILLIFLAFKIDIQVIVAVSVIMFTFMVVTLVIDYFRKKNFYNNLFLDIERLDRSYLVLETIRKPSFYEGRLMCQALYDINKSMAENVNDYANSISDFKEYVEMWIHEVKIPIFSLLLMAHNHRDKYDKKSITQMKRIEDYVEQILYYVRAENASLDYLISRVSIDKVLGKVLLKNKDDLLEEKIDLLINNIDTYVYTDAKWLEFILNQIINNSIKYKRDNIDSYIKISVADKEEKILLMIEDNGIGIKEEDISRVFDRTFTGHNGRIKTKSTGIGLFIVKNLCNKLGHSIEISSVYNEYTRVVISFAKNTYYDVTK